MTHRLHISISFKWYDLWIGIYWDRPGMALYVCLLPMLPIKIWATEHAICPECGAPTHKIANHTGDGWALEWECDKQPGFHLTPYEGWPVPSGEPLSGRDLTRLGFDVQ